MDNFTENGGRSLGQQEDAAREQAEEIRLDRQAYDALDMAHRAAFDLAGAKGQIAGLLAYETDPKVLWFLWEETSGAAIKLLELADKALKARRAILEGGEE